MIAKNIAGLPSSAFGEIPEISRSSFILAAICPICSNMTKKYHKGTTTFKFPLAAPVEHEVVPSDRLRTESLIAMIYRLFIEDVRVIREILIEAN